MCNGVQLNTPPTASHAPLAPGIFAWFGIPIPFADRLKMIRDAGFEATSIWWEEEDETHRRRRHLMPEAVRRAGLELDNIHVPFKGCNALWSPHTEERLAAVDQHRRWLRDCAAHGIPLMVMHAIGNLSGTGLDGTPHAASASPAFARGLDSLRRIADEAAACGVTAAIENTRGTRHLEALLDAINTPSIGLCYDNGHDLVFSEEPVHILRSLGPRLAAVHFSDNDGRMDRHWLPGEGRADFAALQQAYDWRRFKGPLMLEAVLRDRKEHPGAFLERARLAAEHVKTMLLAGTRSIETA
jgi:sugar phosphate isomerase/epimerase